MNLTESAEQLKVHALQALSDCHTEAELYQLKASYLGKKGQLTLLLREIPKLPPEERRSSGSGLHRVKQSLEAAFQERVQAIQLEALRGAREPMDLTLPGRRGWRGHLHPVTLAQRDICSIFASMGFVVEEGPEVETDWHCFEALNIPEGHPAREMQDTFYITEKTLLRTHTSPVQIRTMLEQKPPVRMICPGPVYRRDNDNTHTPMFHQVEGLVLDQRTSMADLKATLAQFAKAFFGPSTKIRFRASYFPFTEPSAEVDVSCPFCKPQGSCRVCRDTGWLEVLGCGMVDPTVLIAMGLDPELIQGYAFGMGIDRLAMLRYGIHDLRLLFENDVRLLEQF